MAEIDNQILKVKTNGRRQRYARTEEKSTLLSLTPPKMALLRWLAEMRFLSLPQLARLVCTSAGNEEKGNEEQERDLLAERSARRHLRPLFDAGLVDVLPVSRAALAAPDAPNDASLLYGSAPNVYVPTAKGLHAACQVGGITVEMSKRAIPSYGPKNSQFLAHALLVRNVRVWLECAARHHGGDHAVLNWREGGEAAIPLFASREVRPDAWFVYQVSASPKRVLVGLVEVDRGTERGGARWQEKIAAYSVLFSGGYLEATTGYFNARVMVFTPDVRRRDGLAQFIGEQGQEIAPRVWLTEMETLQGNELTAPVWQIPLEPGLRPLLILEVTR